MLELGDRQRIPVVMLTLDAVLILSARIKLGRDSAERGGVATQCLLGDQLHADATHARGGAGEVALDERGIQSDGFPQLGTAVTLQGRDAHLGHDLQKAFTHCLYVVVLRIAV